MNEFIGEGGRIEIAAVSFNIGSSPISVLMPPSTGDKSGFSVELQPNLSGVVL